MRGKYAFMVHLEYLIIFLSYVIKIVDVIF